MGWRFRQLLEITVKNISGPDDKVVRLMENMYLKNETYAQHHLESLLKHAEFDCQSESISTLRSETDSDSESESDTDSDYVQFSDSIKISLYSGYAGTEMFYKMTIFTEGWKNGLEEEVIEYFENIGCHVRAFMMRTEDGDSFSTYMTGGFGEHFIMDNEHSIYIDYMDDLYMDFMEADACSKTLSCPIEKTHLQMKEHPLLPIIKQFVGPCHCCHHNNHSDENNDEDSDECCIQLNNIYRPTYDEDFVFSIECKYCAWKHCFTEYMKTTEAESSLQLFTVHIHSKDDDENDDNDDNDDDNDDDENDDENDDDDKTHNNIIITLRNDINADIEPISFSFNGCICPYDYNTEQIICGSLKQLFIEKLEKQYGIKDAIFVINDDNDYIENN